LQVLDESHMHSRGLQTHFKAVVVSEQFAGLNRVKRHQKVYATLGELMGEFHALALHTYTPKNGHKSTQPRPRRPVPAAAPVLAASNIHLASSAIESATRRSAGAFFASGSPLTRVATWRNTHDTTDCRGGTV
jgi:stress-induced morphogen